MKTDGVMNNKQCKEFVNKAVNRQVKAIADCRKTMSVESKSFMDCILKCVLQKEGILTADGYVDEASALAYVAREFPADLQPKAVELMTRCRDYTDSIKPEEATCLSYNPLINCAMGVLLKVCDN